MVEKKKKEEEREKMRKKEEREEKVRVTKKKKEEEKEWKKIREQVARDITAERNAKRKREEQKGKEERERKRIRLQKIKERTKENLPKAIDPLKEVEDWREKEKKKKVEEQNERKKREDKRKEEQAELIRCCGNCWRKDEIQEHIITEHLPQQRKKLVMENLAGYGAGGRTRGMGLERQKEEWIEKQLEKDGMDKGRMKLPGTGKGEKRRVCRLCSIITGGERAWVTHTFVKALRADRAHKVELGVGPNQKMDLMVVLIDHGWVYGGEEDEEEPADGSWVEVAELEEENTESHLDFSVDDED